MKQGAGGRYQGTGKETLPPAPCSLPPVLLAWIGDTTDEAGNLEIMGVSGDRLLSVPITELKSAWKKPFGALI
jgi:hypothetical protein